MKECSLVNDDVKVACMPVSRVLGLMAVLVAGLMVLPLARAADGKVEPSATAAQVERKVAGWHKESAAKVERELLAKYGEGQKARITRGLDQVGKFWREEDGDGPAFEAFVLKNFAGDQGTLDTLFARFERLFEKIGGHLTELRYEFRLQTDLALGPILPVDELFAGYEPGAHLSDDFFANKIAFIILLNFPLYTLDQFLAEGSGWTRRQWAEARLAQQYSKRIPADVQQAMSAAQSEAEIYISEYKICMHHVLGEKGERWFPAKLRLSSHWGLRDELKAQYNNTTNGVSRQRLILKIMQRVIDQSIPAAVINNPAVDWDPVSNEVTPSKVVDLEPTAGRTGVVSNAAEPDTRYAKWITVFRSCRKADPFSPTAPTLIDRSFAEGRQMSEARVKAMLQQLLTSTQFADVGRLIEKRLGRPLEPFDIWYSGFRPREEVPATKIDEIVRKKYPTAEAYHEGMPEILRKLDFNDQQAAFLKDNIEVQPVRGCGHAMGGAMRGQKARLRTGVESDGMNYEGFNTAMHEMGHNIEQTFSLNHVDHNLLQGVPNNAFTEGLAMLVQGHDLEVLGLAKPDAGAEALLTLNDFWATCEIAGMALTDIAAWHWLYEHPESTPAEFKAAVLQIATGIWNAYYAPVFKQRDVTLPAIYSHMVNCVLYLPDYPVGHLIGFQIAEQMKKAGKIGPEFERMVIQGNVTPDVWMKAATGAPVGPEAMLKAAGKALDEVAKGKPLPWPKPSQILRLWPGDAPGWIQSTQAECIVNERIKNVSVPELWAWFPQKSGRSRAALMICPGGAYNHLAMGLHAGNVVSLFNERDVVVFGLKYRTRYGKNHVDDDAVADCARAVRLIRLHADEWGIDPSRIGVQGYSAGGNVGLNLLGHFDEGNPGATDPAEKLSSRPDFVALMCPWPAGKSMARYPVNKNPPPVFIASAQDDKTATTAFAKEIAEAVKKQGGTVQLFIVPTGGHGAFHYGVEKGPGAKWPEELLPMIQRTGSGKTAP